MMVETEGPAVVPEPTDNPLLLKVPMVARLLSLGETTVWDLIDKGELPRVRIGKSVRVPRAAVEAFVERRLTGEQG